MTEFSLEQPRCNFCPNHLTVEDFAKQAIKTMVLLDVGTVKPALMRTPEKADVEKIQALYEQLSEDDIHLRFLSNLTVDKVAEYSTEVSAVEHPEKSYDIIVEHDNAVIAHGGLVLHKQTDHGDLHFVVDPAFRRHGIATAMVDNVVQSAQALGVKRLSADVAPYNEPMRNRLKSVPERLGLDPVSVKTEYESGCFNWTLDLAGSNRASICALNGLVCQLNLANKKQKLSASV